MTLSDVSIKNPVFAWMLMIGLMAFGWIGFHRMGISQLPDVDFPVVTVTVTWEDAAPEIMETQVADTIEDAVMSVEGIQDVYSTSSLGQTQITVEFNLSRNIDARSRTSRATSPRPQKNLPQQDRLPPSSRRSTPRTSRSSGSVLKAKPGADVSLTELCRYINEHLKDQPMVCSSRPARTVGGGAAVDITPRSAALDAHFSSPLAKRLALEHRVDLSALEGTGPRGRISRADVARAAGVSVALRPAPAAFEVSRLSATRKAIARQLTLSKSTIPHFYLRTQLNLDALSALRTESKRSTGTTPSLNDYFIRACALALMQVPDVNIQVHGDAIHRFRDADIAVAVAADRGLITPIIRAAQTKSVHVLAEELRSLAERARAGRLHAGEIDGGSFTVSNLGMFGIDQFDAIINPPQGAILAIGSASARPIEHGGGLRIATTAHLSLSCDHRAIDGAVGARFLVTLRELLEAPARL